MVKFVFYAKFPAPFMLDRNIIIIIVIIIIVYNLTKKLFHDLILIKIVIYAVNKRDSTLRYTLEIRIRNEYYRNFDFCPTHVQLDFTKANTYDNKTIHYIMLLLYFIIRIRPSPIGINNKLFHIIL